MVVVVNVVVGFFLCCFVYYLFVAQETDIKLAIMSEATITN